MTEFVKQDFSGARFERVDFSRAWFRNVYFTGATVRGAWLEDVDIDGEIRNVRINGVDIGPLVEAELNRRYPERTKLCLLYTSPSPRDRTRSRMPSSA